MKRFLVTGGTGLIGSHFIDQVKNESEVHVLTRGKSKNINHIYFHHWNIEDNILDISYEILSNIDVIINLSGANVGEKRWTKNRKQLLIDSRIKSTHLLLNTIKKTPHKKPLVIAASAVGYYGMQTTNVTFTEEHSHHDDFFGRLCYEWENANQEFENIGCNVSYLRFGVVLAKDGGMFTKLKPITKLGVISPLGSGKQFMPWIHIEDLMRIIHWCIHNQKHGIYNAVASEHIMNKDFIHLLAKMLNRKILLPNVPSFVLKLFLGEMSKMLLEGNKVSNEKLLKNGFVFTYPTLKEAMIDIAQ